MKISVWSIFTHQFSLELHLGKASLHENLWVYLPGGPRTPSSL
jgi:hypothetical protein